MEGTKLEAVDCLSLIRIGDGRELFTLSREGELKSLVGQYCLGAKSVAENQPIQLINCNSCGVAATCRFEFGANGDIKMRAGGADGGGGLDFAMKNFCVTADTDQMIN